MKSKRPNMPSAAALHTASQKEQNCLFCDSAAQKSENCPDHNVVTRKEKLKKMGRCFVCQEQKHIAKFCKVKDVSCATCRSRHHQRCQLSRFHRVTLISTISHALTSYLVYFTLKRQRQTSSQANIVNSNGRRAG